VSVSRNSSRPRLFLWSVAAALGAIFVWLWWWSARHANLDSLAKIVRLRFPKVRQLGAAELAEWLASGRPQPLLLDVRGFAEYAVSHLPGARWIDPSAAVQRLNLGVAKDAPIVAYCAVGYRSSEFAQRLAKLGFTDVQNLEGSIFQWANEGRPLVRGEGASAATIHPYSNFWKRLVKPERRAALPA
jgi:rhodanese-related sulfurtransferase